LLLSNTVTTARPKPSSILRPLRDVEKDHIEKVLKHYHWNQSQTATVLGIDRKTLRNKIREFGLQKDV
jgi:DNA-binding NtrC family response regulator